jgi:hypothetical protein
MKASDPTLLGFVGAQQRYVAIAEVIMTHSSVSRVEIPLPNSVGKWRLISRILDSQNNKDMECSELPAPRFLNVMMVSLFGENCN